MSLGPEPLNSEKEANLMDVPAARPAGSEGWSCLSAITKLSSEGRAAIT